MWPKTSSALPWSGPRTSAIPHIWSAAQARRHQPRTVAHARPQADVPGLALVDDVDVPGGLALQQHLLQGGLGAEPAEPRHLHVRRVAHAVRAGQQRGVAERAQAALVLDA